MGALTSQVARASRGVRRGIALGLGEAGATVYVTGRTERQSQGPEPLPGTIPAMAAEVTVLGGASPSGATTRTPLRRGVAVEIVNALRETQ